MSFAVPSHPAPSRPHRGGVIARWIAVLVLAPVLIAAIAHYDIPLFLYLQAHISGPSPAAATFWSIVTVLGSGAGILAAVSPIWRKHPELGPSMLAATILCGGTVQLIKHAAPVPIPRPLGVLGDSMVLVIGSALRSGSFPSGHTAAAFGCATVLIATGIVRGPMRFVLILAAAAIALSRIAVGAHWPSDLAAGVLIGWLAGLAGCRLAERLSATWQHRLTVLAGIVLFGCGIGLIVANLGYPAAVFFYRALGVLCVAVVAWAWIERLPAVAGRTRR